MDISTLVRDKDKVFDALSEVKVGNNYTLVAKQKLDVYFPKYWLESELGSFESKVNVIGFIAIVLDDKYFSHIDVLSYITFNPYDSSSVKIEDVEYFKLSYLPGETMVDNTTLVKDGVTSARAFNEFMSKSKIPWYLRYVDVCTMFYTSELHAGYNTKTDKAIESFMTANRSRDPSDPSKLFRYSIKSQDDLMNASPIMLPLTSISVASNTTSRFAGSYMKKGIVESTINPTETLEDTDKLLFL